MCAEPSFAQPEWRKQCYMLLGPEAGHTPPPPQPGVTSVIGKKKRQLLTHNRKLSY
jgi:hypothetical protein